MDIRRREHFLVLGLEMADFDLVDVGPGSVAGASPISAKPETQEDYERFFRLAFPGKDPNLPAFIAQLGMILRSWLKIQRINPMLKNEEIAGLRWILLGVQPNSLRIPVVFKRLSLIHRNNLPAFKEKVLRVGIMVTNEHIEYVVTHHNHHI